MQPRNRTRYASLNIVNADPRVDHVFQDEDGIWLFLNPGWTADPHDAHDIHEDTVRDVLAKYRRLQPCACDGCTQWLQQIAAARKGA